MTFLSVRLFGLFGPGQQAMLPARISEAVHNGSKIYLEPSPVDPKDDGGLKVSFMYVRDTALCLVRLAELAMEGASLPKRLNVAGKEPISLRHFAETVGKILGKKPRFERMDQPREFDLIADISRLQDLVKPSFTAFEEAMAVTYREARM
jgi:nucleoside-diphosphate-sugar epimerase